MRNPNWHSSRPNILPGEFLSAAAVGAIPEPFGQLRLPFGDWDAQHNRGVDMMMAHDVLTGWRKPPMPATRWFNPKTDPHIPMNFWRAA